MRKKRLIYFFLFTLSFTAHAQEQIIKIWPNLAPGSENVEDKEQWTDGKSVSNVYQPNLTVFIPKQQKGHAPAVIVCPGGGYQKIVMQKEGYKIAEWLNENGIVAFVLKYRLKRDEALRDAQRAVSLIRSYAKDYNIDTDKIGLIGFSAGAHLSGNLAANHQNREYYDAIDSVSARPDFWIGVYGGGYKDMYDKDGKIKMKDKLPPAFLVHAGNDSQVPVQNSVELYLDLQKNKVPAELHVYEEGEHGFALEKNRGDAVTSTVNDWSQRCIEWLKVRGILKF